MADFPVQLVTRTFSDFVKMQCSLVQMLDGTVTTDRNSSCSVSSLNAGPFNRSGQNTVFPINWRDKLYMKDTSGIVWLSTTIHVVH